mgnify:FL=1
MLFRSPGDEEVSDIPGINVVDWVLIEVREASIPEEATSEAVTGRQAAFLMNDGTIRSFIGDTSLRFEYALTEDLFVVVYHRDHLAIMSSEPLTETDGVYQYDFTTSANQVYGGASGYKEITPGIWGMVGGDANADGVINNDDYVSGWKLKAGLSGYESSDFTLDNQVDNTDKNDIWLPNSGEGTQIPEISGKNYITQVPK